MQKSGGNCSIQYVGRENIENKLLASLSEDAKVACVFTCDELTLLIDTFKQVRQPTDAQKAWRMTCGPSARRRTVYRRAHDRAPAHVTG